MKLRQWLFLIYCSPLLISGVACASQDPQMPGTAKVNKISLREVIAFALDRDPSVNLQAAQIGIGEAQIDEARSAWMPQIILNGGTGRNKTTDAGGALNTSASWGMTLTQLVYDFGKTHNAIAQREAQRDGYRFQLMATLTSVAEKSAQAFIEIKRYSELTEAARISAAELENVQRMARLRAEAGLSSRSDELQTQARLSGLRALQQQYAAALQSAKARLAVICGIVAEEYEALPELQRVRYDNLDSIDFATLPAVSAARSMEKSSQYNIAQAKAQHWPTISVKGGRTRYTADNRAWWDDQIQLSVDMPVYQGGAVSARVQQAEGGRVQAASQREQAKFELLLKASVAKADWQGARGRIASVQAQLTSAQHTRQVYKNEYTLGKRSINDLLSAEQDVWQALSAKIMAEYDGRAAAVAYEAAIDNLLPAVGIAQKKLSELPELN